MLRYRLRKLVEGILPRSSTLFQQISFEGENIPSEKSVEQVINSKLFGNSNHALQIVGVCDNNSTLICFAKQTSSLLNIKIDNLIEMYLRLNKSTPIFQTIQEIPRVARRPRSWREQRQNDGPIYYMIVRRKPQKVFVFRILYEVNLIFIY